MKRLGSILAAATLMTACAPEDDVDGVRNVLPSAEAVRIKVPGETGGEKPGKHEAALLGETAEFYRFTRVVSRDINGGAAFVLILVKTIVSYPVTSIEGDTYIWGPWSDALNPSEYRLTVRQNAALDYEWSLEGRRKSDGASAPFEAVVAGVATPGRPNRGSGTFTIDFDTAEKLDPVGNDAQGQLSATYDLESDPASLIIDYERDAAQPDGTIAKATLHYEYAEASDRSGDFQFSLHGDLDENGSAWERADVRSRWLPTGEGRADVKIQGGDMGTVTVTASECWDASFGRVYWQDSVNWQPVEGEVSACAFAEAKLPGE